MDKTEKMQIALERATHNMRILNEQINNIPVNGPFVALMHDIQTGMVATIDVLENYDKIENKPEKEVKKNG